jgi:hypothetical protein
VREVSREDALGSAFPGNQSPRLRSHTTMPTFAAAMFGAHLATEGVSLTHLSFSTRIEDVTPAKLV